MQSNTEPDTDHIAASARGPAQTEVAREVRWLSPEEMRVWRPYVVTATGVISSLDAEMKAAYDISHLDHSILIFLEDAPEPGRRMTDIALFFNVDPSTVTYRVRRLEKRGLVVREGCPSDRRVVYARLTDAGRRLLVEAAPLHVSSVRRHFLDHIAPEQLPVLAEAFARLHASQHGDRSHIPDRREDGSEPTKV